MDQSCFLAFSSAGSVSLLLTTVTLIEISANLIINMALRCKIKCTCFCALGRKSKICSQQMGAKSEILPVCYFCRAH